MNWEWLLLLISTVQEPGESNSPEFTLDTMLFPNPSDENCPIDEPHIIIFADDESNKVYAMNMVKDIKPKLLSYAELQSFIEERTVLKGKFVTPQYMKVPDRYISETHKSNREKKMLIIQPVLDNLEQFLNGSYGKKLVATSVKGSIKKVSRTNVYRHLYRYWRYASKGNAFLRKPGSGTSTNKIYKKKTGVNNHIGHMRNKDDEKNIIKALNKYYICGDPMYLKETYLKLKDLYYSDPIFDPLSNQLVEYDHWRDNRYLSERQFMTFANEYLGRNKAKVLDGQGKTDLHAKDEAGLSGTINDFYDKGPGYYYLIDETPLDVELVSEFDPERKLRTGKPTGYVVRDMSTKAFVGLYITYRKSSSHTASNIMYIAFRNKQKFCAELGIDISEDEWPMEGKCRNIMVDNAEFAADLRRSLAKDAQVTVHFNEEGNSQKKGLVERAFKMLHDCLRGKVKGYNPANMPDHLKRIVRKKALLNINELYQILISYITIYNNYGINKNIVLSKEMAKQKVKRIPTSAWNYGKVYRAGYLRPVDEDELALDLLEVGRVTVHPDHLYLQGMGFMYKCAWTYENGLQDKSITPRPQFPCRYMRHSPNYILIETPSGLMPATYITKTGPFENIPFEMAQLEQKVIDEEEKKSIAMHEQKQSRTRIIIDKTQDKALNEQQPINANQANTQDLSENRDLSIEAENKLDAGNFEQKFEKVHDISTADVAHTMTSHETSDAPDKSSEFADIVRKRRALKKSRSKN